MASVDAVATPAPSAYTPRHLAERILAGREALEGERKQVTILFADVVGSTELIRGRDAEEAQQLLDGVVRQMMQAVHRYEGTVSRLTGDGLMAMFGAPIAHEDHAVRASYAALAMLDAVRHHAAEIRRTHGVTLTIRVGLSSGEVVVRTISDDLHMDYTAMGQTVHLAARMEQLAEPGTATVAPETRELIEGYLQLRALGAMPIKGLDAPIEVCQLIGVGEARTRLQAAATRGLTPFIGRRDERATIDRAVARAQSGRGQVVALVGEPGVGKSRLVYEVSRQATASGWLVLATGAASYGAGTPYLPVVELLKRYVGIDPGDAATTMRDRLAARLDSLDPTLNTILTPLLALLDLPVDDAAWATLDPSHRRRRTLDAVKHLLLSECRRQPLLLAFEDLHWIDSETQALLDELVESLPVARLLLLVNYRPEYAHGWAGKSDHTQVRMDPLANESAEQLLRSQLGDGAALDSLAGLLIERTGGNPLFLEESIRSLVETGVLTGQRGSYALTRDVRDVSVPATVQVILAARIDRLPAAEKRLLQTAAVIGKDVPFRLLQAIADQSESTLHATLARLQTAELLYPVSFFPELQLTFKHALTHEVAYGSLLQERRRQLHGQIVDAIENIYPDRLDEQVERLAHHAQQAGRWEQATNYARRAAIRALARSAYREAASSFEQAIAALAHLPETPERAAQAVDLRLDLQQALIPLADFDRIRSCLEEAQSIAQAADDRARLGRVAFVMTHCLWNQGEHRRALQAADDALSLADATGDSSLRVAATYLVSYVYRDLGQYRRAVDCLRRTVDVLAGPLAGERFGLAGYPAVMSRTIMSSSLVELGEFDEAAEHADVAIRLAEALDHPYSISIGYAGRGSVLLRRDQVEAAIAPIERALAICEQWSMPHNMPSIVGMLGHAYALSGREEALPLLERIRQVILTGAWSRDASRNASRLAEDYLLIGQVDEATRLAMHARELAVTYRERGSEAWASRALGEIAARRDAPDAEQADSRYQQALALAQALEMRPLQAHCHLGIGSLHRHSGLIDSARDHLGTAITMLREMGMTFWLPKAEAELAAASSAHADRR